MIVIATASTSLKGRRAAIVGVRTTSSLSRHSSPPHRQLLGPASLPHIETPPTMSVDAGIKKRGSICLEEVEALLALKKIPRCDDDDSDYDEDRRRTWAAAAAMSPRRLQPQQQLQQQLQQPVQNRDAPAHPVKFLLLPPRPAATNTPGNMVLMGRPMPLKPRLPQAVVTLERRGQQPLSKTSSSTQSTTITSNSTSDAATTAAAAVASNNTVCSAAAARPSKKAKKQPQQRQ
jgi:hypothetical protein